ncbi:MAG: hypothetical protein WDZ41_05065 [Candidatus Babeliales bacterium]
MKYKIFGFSVCILIHYGLNALIWVQPESKPTSYLFAPGIHSSEKQVSKYCFEYYSSTNQIIYTDNDFEVIGSAVTAINFPEIIINAPTNFEKSKQFIGKIYNHIAQWRNAKNDAHNNVIALDTPETVTDILKAPIDYTGINFGQEKDIQALSAAYDQHISIYPDTDIVLYGVSRGAATSFNFLATEYHNKKIKNIKAVILEGCFDSIENILKQKFPILFKFAQITDNFKKIFSWIYPNHQLNGIVPINLINTFPTDIPVLFITSKKDTVVPAVCTWNVYNTLKNNGFTNIFIHELQHSSHPGYTIDNESDICEYQTIVHAFYKQHNLNYNSEFADGGNIFLPAN